MGDEGIRGLLGGLIMRDVEEEIGGGWRKGPWTPEEDKLLIQHVNLHGEGRWNSVSTLTGLRRNGKSCRLRWVNYLRPDLKRGQITPHEETMILHLHQLWGNRWSTIARSLPGRTDNEIKNYWRTHFKKTDKTTLDNSAKLKSRLLKRQKFQQEQFQLQQKEADMKRVMFSVNESVNKVGYTPNPMNKVNEQVEGFFYPMMFDGGTYGSFHDHDDHMLEHETSCMNHEDHVVLWDGLWNMEDVHGLQPRPFF